MLDLARWLVPGLLLLGLVATGCAADPTPASGTGAAAEREAPRQARPTVPGSTLTPAPAGPRTSDGRPARAVLHVPALDVSGLVVVPYRGRTDDARGTEIQNAGDAASPHGPRGGVGPGGIGNFQVTGHRLSSTMPFRYLPRLSRGDLVHVDARGHRFVYRIVGTRSTSFRSARSLREQRAAVPGHPAAEPTRAMLTLSTCATIEDHAAGNFWADRFDNPEHRIDKIGVLMRSRRL